MALIRVALEPPPCEELPKDRAEDASHEYYGGGQGKSGRRNGGQRCAGQCITPGVQIFALK